MPKVRVNDIDLFYHEEGSGPAVVFCHGIGGNHLSWWQQVPAFSGRYRSITFDQRGFGSSLNHDGVGAEAFPSDLAGLLDQLGIGEVFLVGQSMGGRTILNFAKRYPQRVKAIVMASTVANIRTPELDALRHKVRNTLTNRLHAALSDRTWEERPHLGYLYRLIRLHNPSRPPDFLRRDNIPGTTAAELAALRTPTLFVIGEEDRIAPPPMTQEAFRHFPNARMHRVPEAAHSVYFEKPEVFNRVVMDFFQEHA